MSDYTKNHDPWVDYPSTSTPLTAAKLDVMEAGIDTAHSELQAHLDDAADAHNVTAITGAASLALIIALG